MTQPPLTSAAVAALCAQIEANLAGTEKEFYTAEVYEQLTTYLGLLVKWNKVMNLVGGYEWEDILRILLADSFYLAEFLRSLPLDAQPECWDLGAGAGLPGIPLRMVWQKGQYHLVEAREKRALFLQTVLSACPLPNVAVFRGRAEAFMPTRPKANLVVSRAFMPWEKVLELVKDYMEDNGFVAFLTLMPAPEEVPAGWQVVGSSQYTIMHDKRYLWAIQRCA